MGAALALAGIPDVQNVETTLQTLHLAITINFEIAHFAGHERCRCRCRTFVRQSRDAESPPESLRLNRTAAHDSRLWYERTWRLQGALRTAIVALAPCN